MAPDYGISLGYEQDKCSLCQKEKEIRIIYCKSKKQIALLCDECVKDLGETSIQEIIERYGKKTTTKHIEILTKQELEKKGFELTGKK